ncbi:RNA polymerase sigma factor [Mucilaginibacter sp. FT3.2]|uniref:RNA polymerase sigma factor n=1 Tax=Mucilaginibacter sp. FT3.2 TaxID=2723090 RepID=UPI00160E35A8|nr:sigma-70 family RNA polymerase sigma factor [Mucilaginibacter sp. FT3.2]MBB6234520.1 RNA polymerase sigma-70 factor (ECF subfamily) [Mucilaginibacter sp. FT3.2]
MVASLSKSDKELTTLMKNGNVLAFTQLYHRYSSKMYANMFRMVKDKEVAVEMVQVLFSRIWQQREAITYEHDFAAYLYRAGSNLVCDFYRKLESDRKMTAHFKSTIIEHYSHIEEKIFFKESEILLEQALAKLSSQQRQVYQLIKIDGFSYKETAAKLGISPHTVKEYLSKAKNLVKSYMIKNMEIVTFLMIGFYIALLW